MKPSRPAARGSIRADELLPIGVFMRRLGIGRHSLTALRRRGLPVRMIGTRAFVDGAEALEALRRFWRAEKIQQQAQDPAEEGGL